MASSTKAAFQPIVQLKELLGPKPNHPWGVLLPQVLLWSFRRFCVEKLISSSDTPLSDQLWDDHMELLYKYVPKGLEAACNDWFTPENCEYMSSTLDDYNRFMIDCIVEIDESLRHDDEFMQDLLSEFLDEDIYVTLREWVEDEFRPFLIFPCTDEDDDCFQESQFMRLIESLLKYSQENPQGAEADEPMPEPSLPAISEEEAPPPTVPPPPPPVVADPRPPVSLTAAAMSIRRRTLCMRPRDRSTRGKTRRLHPRA